MTQAVTIYHNPRCSKSCQALALLWAAGAQPTVIDYLAQPPDADTIARLLKLLGTDARSLLRSKESEYQTQGLANPNLGEQQLIEAMVKTPRLIERPIVVVGSRAIVARPPELVLSLLKA
ncbi:arsenate reductase (glutaredoxin) [Chitinimonas lacunae]|uniref:Arsenate reductase n=1 Tax=Chitinimonas lacunae TaxID=1963018 RepID=A0ABV8MRF9_9NEIS